MRYGVWQQGVAGVDEVGRGPLAGPVVAACVLITHDFDGLERVNDSKKLSAAARVRLDAEIRANTVWALGAASVAEIETHNILQATFIAMRRAIARMERMPDALLIDGNKVPPQLTIPARAVIGGDGLEPAIACASIIAKVARDRLMGRLAQRYPNYAWEKNAGYGTQAHMAGVDAVGVTKHHRLTFGPLQKYKPGVSPQPSRADGGQTTGRDQNPQDNAQRQRANAHGF